MGESQNARARAVCFRRLGRLHDRTAQAQVTAAIVLWNTAYLGRALDVVAAVAIRCRTNCSPTLRRSAGSTST
jgi:TnpA family transposase